MDDAIAMLESCAVQFKLLADRARHLKPTPIKEAEQHMEWAERCEEVVKRHNGSRDLAKIEHVPDYRFGTFIKAENYAFARGLTINPSHLPGALDAMDRDGWSLVAIFGATESQHIGFIFRRNENAPK